MTLSSRPAALIVEDQPFVGLVASDILRETGFETLHAYDASDALEMLRSHPEIEVMVTEAQLPGSVSGVELSRRVSQERPHVHLVITGAAPELNNNTDMPGHARLLRKPYASAELRTLVTALTLLQDA
jgi:CheY-like chemotaxis protein